MVLMHKRVAAALMAALMVVPLASCSAEEPMMPERKISSVKIEKPKLGDNYYGYVNFDYLSQGQIPYGKSGYGTMDSVRDDVEKAVSHLISRCAAGKHKSGSFEEMIKILYEQYNDDEGRDEAGVGVLLQAAGMVNECRTTDELIDALGVLYRQYGVSAFFRFAVDNDFADSSVNNLSIYSMNSCGNLKENFTKTDAGIDDIGSLVEDTLTAMQVDSKDARKGAEDTVKLVNDIMTASLDYSAVNDVDKHYNMYTSAELSNLYSNIDTKRLLKAFGFSADRVMIYDEGQCRKVNELFTQDNLRMLQDYSLTCLMFEYKSVLPPSITKQYSSLKQDGNSGNDPAKQLISTLLKEELGCIYGKENYKEEQKKAVEQMTSDLKASMKKLINNCERLSADSKKKFIKKLDNMKFLLGYQSDYTAPFTITSTKDNGTLIANVMAIKSGRIRRESSKLNSKTDRNVWYISPMETDAVYNPSFNTVTIPVAMMNKTMLDPSAGKYRNYGMLGYVVAHEINHAFDALGFKFDENGNYNKSWMNEKDQKAYLELLDKIKEYYNSYKILGIYPINGEQTLSENVADLGAVQCLLNTTNKKEEQQEIMEGVAKQWASLTLVTDVAQKLEVDLHSPEEARVNAVVSCMDQFYSVYQIEKTDKMYVAPEKRVRVW